MKPFNVDLSLEDVARIKNALDPVDPQDYVTRAYFEGLRYRMSAAQTSTIVAPTNLTGLTTASLPVGNYSVRAAVLIRSAASATGYAIRLKEVAPAVLTNVGIAWQMATNANFTLNHFNVYAQVNTTIDTVTGNIGAANTDYVTLATGFFRVTTAGPVAIQLRTENAGTIVTAGVGSFLIIERLP
jgi:hypothetical protein